MSARLIHCIHCTTYSAHCQYFFEYILSAHLTNFLIDFCAYCISKNIVLFREHLFFFWNLLCLQFSYKLCSDAELCLQAPTKNKCSSLTNSLLPRGLCNPELKSLLKQGGWAAAGPAKRTWLTPSWPTPAGTIRELNIGLSYKSRGGGLGAVVVDGIAEYIG